MGAEFVRAKKTGYVEIPIKDWDGTLIRTIRFNPGDERKRALFAKTKIRYEDSLRELDAIEDNALKQIKAVEMTDELFAILDSIFGTGTMDDVTQGALDEQSFKELKKFLEIITPHYTKAQKEQEERTEEYLIPHDN